MSDSPKWIKEPGGTHEAHWCDFIDPEGWYHASVKWDGCIHFSHVFNTPNYIEPWKSEAKGKEDKEVSDYYHICDIDYLIERLQALKAAALEHFGKDWPR